MSRFSNLTKSTTLLVMGMFVLIGVTFGAATILLSFDLTAFQAKAMFVFLSWCTPLFALAAFFYAKKTLGPMQNLLEQYERNTSIQANAAKAALTQALNYPVKLFFFGSLHEFCGFCFGAFILAYTGKFNSTDVMKIIILGVGCSLITGIADFAIMENRLQPVVRLLTRFYEKPVQSFKLSISVKQLFMVFGLMTFLMIYIYPIFYSQSQKIVEQEIMHHAQYRMGNLIKQLEARQGEVNDDDLRNLFSGEDWYAFLIDQDRMIVKSTSDKVNELYKQFDEPVKQAIFARQNQSQVDPYTEYLVTSAPLPGKPWTVVSMIAPSNYSSGLMQMIYWCIFLGLLALIVGMATAYYFSKSLSAPLEAFIDWGTMLASKAGDLSQKVCIRGIDEMGELGIIFDNIIQNIHDMIWQIRNHSKLTVESSKMLFSSTEQIESANTGITEALQNMTNSTNHQFERMEKTSQLKVQSDLSMNKLNQAVNTTAQETTKTLEQAQAGAQATDSLIARMKETTAALLETSDIIKKLGGLSNDINATTKVIHGIASQTNLLALNAAIEAARAGEAGRGFSVVADEVRKLAESSSKSAGRISSLLGGIKGEIDKSVLSIDRSVNEFQVMEEELDSSKQVYHSISGAIKNIADFISREAMSAIQDQLMHSESLKSAIDEVTKVAQDFSSLTQEVAASTEESAAMISRIVTSSKELSDTSQDLEGMIGRFKLSEESAH